MRNHYKHSVGNGLRNVQITTKYRYKMMGKEKYKSHRLRHFIILINCIYGNCFALSEAVDGAAKDAAVVFGIPGVEIT